MTGALFAIVSLVVVSAATPSAAEQTAPTSAGADATELGGDFRHGTVRADRHTDLHYVIGGSGPPVVLLHGWPQNWWMWHKIMPDLAEQHTVIAFDLPGLGESDPSRVGYDKAATARLIRQAVRKLGYRKVDVVGHDLGALVAYPYARQFPGDVRRIAVMDTPLNGFGLEEMYGLSWHFGFNMSPEPIPELILDDEDVPVYLGMMFAMASDPGLIDEEVYFDAYADPEVRSAGFEYYRAFEANAAWNQANAHPHIRTPVLAVGGEFTFGPMVAESMENVAQDVRPVVVAGSSHYLAEEDPEFVADCLALFLGPRNGVPSRPELAPCTP